MSLYQKLINGEEKLALVGLGYVGMPIAVAFANKGIHVVGFDLNTAKIEAYKSGIDPTKEVGDEAIKNTSVDFTSDQKRLREAKFFIVAVPTPVNLDHTPDLTPVIGASEIIGSNITKGSIIVYESRIALIQLGLDSLSNSSLNAIDLRLPFLSRGNFTNGSSIMSFLKALT